MQGTTAARSVRSVDDQISDYERREAQRELEQWVALDDLGILDLDMWSEDRLPDAEWMVDKHFLKGSVGIVAGDGGVGKSTLMQQLVTCAAMGLPWLGFHLERGPGLLLACEDDYIQLLHRHRAITRMLGIPFHAPKQGGLQIWPRVGQDNSMMYLDRSTWKMAPTHLFERICLRCKRQGIKYLIVDTATQTFRGNQNDETQVMDYISAWRQLALAMEGCVIITKHPSLSGRALGTGESGNTAWSNSARSRFYLHKDKGTGKLLWSIRKSNYGPADIELPLRWQAGAYVLDEPEEHYEERYYQR